MRVILAQPRGFCAGVTRAITIVRRALAVYGRPVYVRHEIVHNRAVVEELRRRGAVFVEELSAVPPGATLVFSAHGAPAQVMAEARRRGLRVFDATCPLVTKVHREVIRMRREGKLIIMIGHAGHPEVEGTMGQAPDGIRLVQTVADVRALPADLSPATLACVTQTTISVDDASDTLAALRARYPGLSEPKKADVCYATQNRQDAVKALARRVDLLLVIGSPNSSNSNRLREVGERHGARAYLIDSAADIDPSWLAEAETVGVTAGASAPESLVVEVVARLRAEFGAESVSDQPGASPERVTFPMPRGLWEEDLRRAGATP